MYENARKSFDNVNNCLRDTDADRESVRFAAIESVRARAIRRSSVLYPPYEAIEESLEKLLFFDFECRHENGNHEANLCIVQNEAGNKWIFEGDNTRDTVTGCLRSNMLIVRPWPTTSTATTVISSCNIYASTVSSTM